MRRLLSVLLPALVLVVPALASGPADAGQVSWRGVIVFDKNWRAPDRSTITWRLWHRVGDHWVVTDHASWRAGSGMLGRRGRNACVRNVGWLPNGTYHLRQYQDYHGTYIKGRAFRLDDKACGNGTVRHELFIHTEQGAHNTQCPDRPGDQYCRWEYPAYDDYTSHGCIKMSPGDLKDLVGHYQLMFRPGIRYSTTRVELKVVT